MNFSKCAFENVLRKDPTVAKTRKFGDMASGLKTPECASNATSNVHWCWVAVAGEGYGTHVQSKISFFSVRKENSHHPHSVSTSLNPAQQDFQVTWNPMRVFVFTDFSFWIQKCLLSAESVDGTDIKLFLLLSVTHEKGITLHSTMASIQPLLSEAWKAK